VTIEFASLLCAKKNSKKTAFWYIIPCIFDFAHLQKAISMTPENKLSTVKNSNTYVISFQETDSSKLTIGYVEIL
jgi:hypothetical protein